MLFSATSFVKGQTEMHGLSVSLSSFSPSIINETYNHLLNGSSTVLNATVTNIGNVSESNVTLQLLINNTVRLSAVTPSLDVNSTFWAAYFWNPTDYVPPMTDYNLTVYAYDSTANNNTTRWVRVCPPQPLAANFTFSPPPPPPGPVQNQPVIFDASNSSDPNRGGPTALTYQWNFGDIYTTSPLPSPTYSHTYASSGNYTVTLTVRDNENFSGTVLQNITVYAQPVANFTIAPSAPYYVNKTLTFDASASYDPKNNTGPHKGIATYTWDFGDSTPKNYSGPIVTHSYGSPGLYNVTLTVTDYLGLNGSYVVPVNVGSGNPVANFTPPSPPCYAGHQLTFDASASYDPKNMTAPNQGIANYTWDFGDTNITTTPNSMIKHIYSNAGNYNVNLTVIDQTGLSNSTVKTVTVTPEIFLGVVDAATGNKVIIHDPGNTFNVNVTVANVTDLYSYDVNLTWPGTKSYPIFVSVPGAVSGGFLAQGAAEHFVYSASSYDGYVRITSTRMNSLNGVNGSGTLATITLQVNDTMTGNCTLLISYSLLKNSTGGTIATTLMSGSFYTDRPVAYFNYTHNAVANATDVIFDASASYDPDNMTAPNQGIANYTWDFGDSTPKNYSGPIVAHRYVYPGLYNVNLTVADYMNLTWSINYTVLVGGPDVAVTGIEINYLQFNATTGMYETVDSLNMSVTVKNLGNAQATFNVTVYFNNTFNGILVENATTTVLNLAANSTASVLLRCKIWNATWFLPPGDYNITAIAGPLPYETNLSDNSLSQGPVRVYVPGDVSRNNVTDIYDAIMLAGALNSKPGDPKWNSNADFNFDRVIDIYDAIILAGNFNRHYP